MPQSQQHWILDPLSEARDQTRILMDTSRVLNSLSHNGNSGSAILNSDSGLTVRPRKEQWCVCVLNLMVVPVAYGSSWAGD